MKLRSRNKPYEIVEAELTKEHPASNGLLALRRIDTGECINLKELFLLPNRKYDALNMSKREILELKANDLYVVSTPATRYND
jgi:hypothetical protein